jgi:hypothetical protein
MMRDDIVDYITWGSWFLTSIELVASAKRSSVSRL